MIIQINSIIDWLVDNSSYKGIDSFVKLLLLVEFAYNNAPSVTTSVSPFFANKRYHLNIIIYPEHNIASFQACNFALDLDELQSILKAEIFATQQYYQESTDI